MNRYVLIFITIILSMVLLHGQDATSDSWRDRADSFLKESIARDLVNSDLNQLKSMALSLGLEVKDENASSYRSALSQFYGVRLIQEPRKTGKKIILERASELKLLKVVEENEETIHILGRVKLILEGENEQKQTVIRTIEADEIFIDLNNKEIMGVKNVYFKDEQLEFKGEQFYYNFEINRGVLFDGQTKMLSSGNSGLKGAFFTGDKIVKTGKDEAVLYNGKLTTCDVEDPHYYINVSRIWLSEEGEWGMLGGTIYVGPIPFFYIPIFYHPKGLKINPALGYRHREGWFLNTTFYLFDDKGGTGSQSTASTEGQTEPKAITGVDKMRAVPVENLFSIKKADVDSRLNDFYDKHKFYEKYPDFRVYPSFNQLDFSSRIFFDAYTNLGFYWGCFFYFKMQDSNFPLEISLLTDYAFSRMIWKDNDSDLYLFFNPADEDTISFPAKTNPLFFRTSQWLNLKGSVRKKVNFDYELQFEYASDKSYYTDFYSRYLDFSYIDLMFEGIEYGVQSSSVDSDIFKTSTEEEKAGAKSNLKSYLNFSISPKAESYPDILGLPLLSSVSGTLRTEIDLKAVELVSPYYLEPHPKLERYMLNKFSAPEFTYKMAGTLFDFDIVKKMPEQVRLNRAAATKEEQARKKRFDELYSNINSAKLEDSTADTNVFDYKQLLPLYSGKIDKNKIFVDGDDNQYNSVALLEDGLIEREKSAEKATVLSERYEQTVLPEENLTAIQEGVIKLFSANLKYSFSDKLNNNFHFNPVAISSSDPTRKWDSFELLLQNGFDASEVAKEFDIYHDLNLRFDGDIGFFKINNLPLLGLRPVLEIKSRWSWSNPDLYRAYLERNQTDLGQINNLLLANAKNDKEQSEFSIYYSDTWTNELSFGRYFLRGTGIKTTFKFRIFKFNEQLKEEFRLLAIDNPGMIDFDINYYDNREWYEKIEDLKSTFTLKFNFLPEGSPHQLNYSVAPTINAVISDSGTNSDLGRLKSELWEDNSGDVNYVSGKNENAAKRYVYYRPDKYNLNDKIREFYYSDEFWAGPKNYRSVFSDVSMTLGYSFKKSNVHYIDFSYTLKLILRNMGSFMTGGGDASVNPFTIYPDNIVKLTFFDSAITYDMSINFTPKVIGSKFYPRALTADEQKLDEFKTMTFINTHTFSFQLKHDLFKVKLPKDNWLKFKSTTVFKYDNEVIWASNSQPYKFFLDSQTFSLSFMMDILNISLNFQSINYADSGYGLALESGKVVLGYKVEEIPVFLKYFKLIFEPRLTYNFTVKHKPYYLTNQEPDYSSLTPVEYGSSFINNNYLTFKFKVDLIIAEGKSFETKFTFSIESENRRMYQFYNENGLRDFFVDMFKSFNFADEQQRKESSFNLKEINFAVEHGLHDWKLKFSYVGKPVSPGVDSGRTKYYWENTFSFLITWKLDSKNQLMKLFNKTKVDEEYKEGQWKQRILSLDPDENN